MIKIVDGDLLKAKENIIGHQVNCQGVMGSGVALQVKKKYPRAFNMYKDFVSSYSTTKEQLMGKTQFVKVSDDKWIANLFGQYNYGRENKQYTKTVDLYNCFTQLREYAESNNLSVALPYMIGCYRGGADWGEVLRMLDASFEGYKLTLYKYDRG